MIATGKLGERYHFYNFEFLESLCKCNFATLKNKQIPKMIFYGFDPSNLETETNLVAYT